MASTESISATFRLPENLINVPTRIVTEVFFVVRRIGALALVAFSAPYLVILWLLMFGPWPELLSQPRSYEMALSIGTLGLMIFGLPVLLASACLFFILEKAGLTTWLSHTIGGTIVGFGAMLVATTLFVDASHRLGIETAYPEISGMRAVGSCIGAICGWLYWLIAIRRTA